MELVTADLSKFGWGEIDMAADLLDAYRKDTPDFFTEGLAINFNTGSGFVFLCDDDFNVGMINSVSKKLEQFFSCPECGTEGFLADYPFDRFSGFCSEKCMRANA